MKLLFSSFVAISLASLVSAAEPLKSGPQVGDKLPGQFDPFNVTGPNAGEELCLYCKFGNDPSVMIFAKESNDALAKLMKSLDELNVKYKKADLGTCAIFCDKGTAQRPTLKALAAKQEYKEIILATLDGAPKEYAINADAQVTILIYDKLVVKANYALKNGELDDKTAAAIVKDVEKMMSGK